MSAGDSAADLAAALGRQERGGPVVGPGPAGLTTRAEILVSAQQQMRRDIAEPHNRLDRQEDQLRQLLLVTEAMWSLVSERFGVSEDDLVARMAEIDAEDGQVDGKRGPHPPETCGTCHAAIDHTRTTCAYCGAPASPSSPFDRI